MIFKKDELKHLWPFYLVYLTIGITSVIIPFMVIYFRDLGFSFLEISILTSAFSVAMFLFEIPTGALADSYGRKTSSILGLVLVGTGLLLMGTFTTYMALLLIWIFIGIGMTFFSGAEEAWVIDNLNKIRRKDLHQDYFIKQQSINAAGAVISPLIGSFIVSFWSIRPLWFVWGLGFITSALILFLFTNEKYIPKDKEIRKAISKTISNTKEGYRFTLKHKTAFFLTLGLMFFSLMSAAMDAWQPFMEQLGMPVYVLGYVYSVSSLLMILTPFASKLFNKIEVKKSLALVSILRGALLVSVLFIYPPFFLVAAVIFVFSEGVYSLRFPLMQTYIHKFIPSKIRATVISLQSMVVQAVFAISGIFAGYFMDVLGLRTVIAFTGLFGILAAIAFMKIKD